MPEVWLVYIGTIGSILKHYIESRYNVIVCEHLLALEYTKSQKNVAMILVINPDFERDIFEAIEEQARNVPIVWFCQNPQNETKPDPSVIKYRCDDTNEWVLLNNILNKYLAPFAKKS